MGFIFTAAAGFPLHFLFELTDSKIIAAVSPVNESPWEHLKLIYFPVLFFLIIQLIYLRRKKTEIPNLIWSTSLSALLSMSVVTVSYYTYSGILGKNVMGIDIFIFIATAALAYFFNYRMIKSRSSRIPGSGLAGIALLLALAALLIVFTYFTPHIPWFRDPTSYLYGLK